MNPITIENITAEVAAAIYAINDETVIASYVGDEPQECELLWNDIEDAYFFLNDMIFYVRDFMRV